MLKLCYDVYTYLDLLGLLNWSFYHYEMFYLMSSNTCLKEHFVS